VAVEGLTVERVWGGGQGEAEMQSVCADIETLCSHLNAACLKMLTDDLCRLVPSPTTTTIHTRTHHTHIREHAETH
jgi:hypothetical protein